ncbi:MAG: hypothetical protein MPN21_26960 [Thermoanaerobaculia bacterium]|nr:hypothetical protein [Thermoanaerobaculia bacterium]
MARRSRSNLRLVLGVVLLAAGLLALVYGGFSYTEKRHDVDLGPLEFSIQDKERVEIPPWVGVVAVVTGAALLATAKR